jgi:tRNA (mo5U34)-methyltransferase
VDAGVLRNRIDRIRWYHPIDLGEAVTRPEWHVQRRFRRRLQLLDLPKDMTGMSVLDVGAWDGFFSFECERRGASRVVAIDSYAWNHYGMDGFLLARETLGSRVEFRRMTVEGVERAMLGSFDLVLFLGVLYHLRSPIEALDKLRAVTQGTLVCETHGLIPAAHGDWPLISFFPGDAKARNEGRELTAIPTLECLQQMLRSAGFAKIDVKYTPSMRTFKRLKALVTNKPQSGRLIVHAS